MVEHKQRVKGLHWMLAEAEPVTLKSRASFLTLGLWVLQGRLYAGIWCHGMPIRRFAQQIDPPTNSSTRKLQKDRKVDLEKMRVSHRRGFPSWKNPWKITAITAAQILKIGGILTRQEETATFLRAARKACAAASELKGGAPVEGSAFAETNINEPSI